MWGPLNLRGLAVAGIMLRMSRIDLPGLFALVPLASLLPLTAQAQPRPAYAPLLQQLRAGQCAGLTLTWTRGPAGLQRGPLQHLTLRCDARGASATLTTCATAKDDACQAGAAQPLSTGQHERLLSTLRALDPAALSRLPPNPDGADRRLRLHSEPPGAAYREAWLLPRQDWPTPTGTSPDLTLAAWLDEHSDALARAGRQRPPVAVPASVAELAQVRLQLRLVPGDTLHSEGPVKNPLGTVAPRRTGVLVVEGGAYQLRLDPPPGGLAAVARPDAAPTRGGPLTQAQQEELVRALQRADLPALEQRVPRREGPALDDRDGRLATLSLFPLGGGSAPRVLSRYVADLTASSAAPLLGQLLALFAPAPAPAPGGPDGRARAPR